MFLVNSRHPLVCAPDPHEPGLLLANLRRYFAEFLQRSSLKRLGMLYQSTCVGFGYDLMEGLFPGTCWLPTQSNKGEQRLRSVTFLLAQEY